MGRGAPGNQTDKEVSERSEDERERKDTRQINQRRMPPPALRQCTGRNQHSLLVYTAFIARSKTLLESTEGSRTPTVPFPWLAPKQWHVLLARPATSPGG